MQNSTTSVRDATTSSDGSMPLVIYLFALTAFALGLAEFAPIGLSDVIARDLHVRVEAVGAVVTAYGLGATFSAPVLSAVTAGWSRRAVILMTAGIFCIGSLGAALANDLTLIVVARFVAGIGHGLFLAVASSVAAKLVGQNRAGSAVAVVFGGFTVALAIGVPISTWLGGVFSWRPLFLATTGFGLIGLVGLMFGMKRDREKDDSARSGAARQSMKAILHPRLLSGALVTVLAYAGSFCAYTYIVPVLTQITGVGIGTVSTFMLIYGVLAAIGNRVGGNMADRLGANIASLIVVAGITIVVLAMSFLSHSVFGLALLIAALGLLSYAAVPVLQARLLGIAEQDVPHAHGVAAGLNIAGFNSGIALGSVIGGVTVSQVGLAWTGLTAAMTAGAGLSLLVLQLRRSAASAGR